MRIVKDKRFQKAFDRLPIELQRRANKQFALLLRNSRHPSLRIKKMEGYGNRWEGRISRNYRFTFEVSGDIYIFRRVGSHDILGK